MRELDARARVFVFHHRPPLIALPRPRGAETVRELARRLDGIEATILPERLMVNDAKDPTFTPRD